MDVRIIATFETITNYEEKEELRRIFEILEKERGKKPTVLLPISKELYEIAEAYADGTYEQKFKIKEFQKEMSLFNETPEMRRNRMLTIAIANLARGGPHRMLGFYPVLISKLKELGIQIVPIGSFRHEVLLGEQYWHLQRSSRKGKETKRYSEFFIEWEKAIAANVAKYVKKHSATEIYLIAPAANASGIFMFLRERGIRPQIFFIPKKIPKRAEYFQEFKKARAKAARKGLKNRLKIFFKRI